MKRPVSSTESQSILGWLLLTAMVSGWLALAAMVLLPVVGCGSKKSPVNELPVFLVTGKLVDGVAPAGKAMVFFHPIVGSKMDKTRPVPVGKTNEDGTFQLSTYLGNDGAPEGDYAVTVIWPKIPDFDDGEDRLGSRCKDPNKSKWHIHVGSNSNDVGTLDLKTWSTGLTKK